MRIHKCRFLKTRARAGHCEANISRSEYIDEDECIGCGSCEEICAEVFRLNQETEKAEVIQPEGGPEDLIEEAMDTCPVECIHWQE